MLVYGAFGQATDTLAIQDFETSPQKPTWTFSGTPVYNSGFSSSSAAPPNSELGINGSRAWELTQVSGGTTLEFANISVPNGYDSIRVKFKLAAMNLNSSTGGPDNLDYVLIEVSDDGGSTYHSRMRIRGAVNNNSFWPYSASAVASLYYLPKTEETFQPTNSGLQTTNGIGTGVITFPGNVGQVRIKITMRSSSSSDTWLMDNVTIVGEKDCPNNLGSSRAVSICQGNGFLAGGKVQTTSGTYYDTLKTSGGCDSVLTTVLTVNPTYFVNQSQTICQGDSAFLEGAYQTTVNTYYDTLKTTQGCDSIIATDLIINPTYFQLTTKTICQGDSVMLGGSYQTTTGTYYDSLKTTNGCDSVIATSLNVNPAYAVSQTYSICQGDSIMLGGAYQTSAGTYYDSLKTTQGCDSIIEATLTIKPIYIANQIAVICQGDSIFLEGVYQTTAGAYYDSLKTTGGCDSIIITVLDVNPSYYVQTTETICAYDSILVNGRYVSAPGTYIDSMKTIAGCDSLIEVVLSNTVVNTSVTQNSNVLTADLSGATSYRWLDCNNGYTFINNETNQTFTATANGDYAVEITANSCVDTSVCYNVTGVGVKGVSFEQILKVYPNPAKTQVSIDFGAEYANATVKVYTLAGQQLISEVYSNQSVATLNTQKLEAGVYLLQIEAAGKQATARLIIE